MRFLRKNWEFFLLLLLMAIYTIVLSTLSIARHDAFASGYDLSNMDSTIWNTLQGNFFQLSDSQKLQSRFALHADLILVVLSPLYLIWNNVRMLLISESIFIALGAVPTYLIAMKILKNRLIAFAIVIMYLINPGIQWTDIYDFHGVSLAIPFVLFSFYFAMTKKWRWYALFIFLALLTKEQISLSVALLGLVVAFVFKEKKPGLITFVIGSTWFIVIVFIVMAHFSPSGKHWALAWYQTDSSKFVEKFTTSPDALVYYKSVLGGFGYLPLLGLPWLLMTLPELTAIMLSSHGQMRSIVFHYDSGLIPWLVISTIYGLHYLQAGLQKVKKSPVKKYAQHITYAILFSALLFVVRYNYHHSPLPTTPSCWCFIYEPTQEDREFEALLQKIPQDASITASPEIRPHITHRVEAYTLPSATASADFIALIDQNRIVGNYEPKEFELVLRDQLEESPNHTLIKQVGHFYLYKRNDFTFILKD